MDGEEADIRYNMFSQRTTNNEQLPGKVTFQHNAQDLHRQEYGGVVVYDSFARIIGNQHLISYFEENPPKKIDFSQLFTPQEIARADKLFYKEPRERDFQNEFDKYMFKHLPKFAPQRDFTCSQQITGNTSTNLQSGQPSHQYTINVPQQDNILIFDSRFESGNLRRAIKVNNIEYNLWLENDVNTKGHTQWFYFKVVHRYPKKQKIQFNILNLAKPQSLYTLGMKICVLSKYHSQDWFRGGEDIKYFQNEIPRKTTNNQMGNNQFLYANSGAGEGAEYYFTLSFMYEFEENETEVYFAQAVPYTFSDLQTDLLSFKEPCQTFMSYNILCKDLTSSPCPLITITENLPTFQDYYDSFQLSKELPNVVRKQLHKKYTKAKKLYRQSLESKGKVRKLLYAAFEEEINSFCENNADVFKQIDETHNSGAGGERRFEQMGAKMKQYIIDHFHKKAIVITCRVHPGEPQSSHMMKGMLDHLVSDEGIELRRNFVFRIVPMLNIDGVIYGNQRCSLLGVDLNRRWVSPNVFLHPTIFYAKQLVRNMHNERRVLMYCDLHGHSRKQNAFFYACTYKNYEHDGRIKNAQLRMLPLLCCHKSPNFFKFSDCRFRIEKVKESTARVVIFREFNIMNAFTLEASFFGKEPDAPPPPSEGQELTYQQQQLQQMFQKPKQGTHFSVMDLRAIGRTLPQILNNYLPREQSKLELLSAKILEIFYEEFVKFIPPYILRREEEKKRQLMGLDGQEAQPGHGTSHNLYIHSNSYNVPAGQSGFTKSPTMASAAINRAQNSNSPNVSSNNLMPNQAPPAGSVLLKVSTSVKKNPNSSVQQTQQLPLDVLSSNPQQQQQPQRKLVKLQTQLPQQSVALAFASSISMSKRGTTAGGPLPASLQASQQVASTSKKPKRKELSITAGGSVKLDNNATGTETDTFSQIIKIHPNQEELLDFEQFIKGENFKLKESNNKCDQDSECEEMGAASDSSADSDESSKNLFVQQSIQQQNRMANKMAKKPIQKKSNKKQKEGDEEIFRSMDGGQSIQSNKQKQFRKQNAAASMLAPRGGHPQQMDSFKFKQAVKPVLQNDSRQSFRFVNKTQAKIPGDATNELQMGFDRIPHKQSKSPKSAIKGKATIELEAADIEGDESSENNNFTRQQSNDQQHKLSLFEEEKNFFGQQSITGTQMQPQQQQQNPFLFKTFEDQQKFFQDPSITQQQHILPLYENPLYHQTRLNSINQSTGAGAGERPSFYQQSMINNANILYNNMKAIVANPFNLRNIQPRQPQPQGHHYEPYNDDGKHKSRITTTRQNQAQTTVKGGSQLQQPKIQITRPSTQQESASIVNKNAVGAPPFSTYKVDKGGGGGNLLLQPILSQEIEQLSKKLKQQALNKPAVQNQSAKKPSSHENGGLLEVPGEPIQSSAVRNGRIHVERSSRQINVAENGSMQRISFKELLESSRQQRVQGVSADKQSVRSYNGAGQFQPNSNLVHMLKNNYNRIQAQQINPNVSQMLQITDEAPQDYREILAMISGQTPKPHAGGAFFLPSTTEAVQNSLSGYQNHATGPSSSTVGASLQSTYRADTKQPFHKAEGSSTYSHQQHNTVTKRNSDISKHQPSISNGNPNFQTPAKHERELPLDKSVIVGGTANGTVFFKQRAYQVSSGGAANQTEISSQVPPVQSITFVRRNGISTAMKGTSSLVNKQR